MIKNFSKYQTLINQFTGQVPKSTFEASFAVATKRMPNNERFLLKMELKRLASLCTRLVDLRGHVDGNCQRFLHDGKTHFLDEVAIKVFQQGVLDYGGFTLGVYESVMNTENNFRVIYNKEKNQSNIAKRPKKVVKSSDKTQYPAEIFNYGPYFKRCEERMNFAILIKVYLRDNDSPIEATSSDISSSGCKFRFSKMETISLNQLIKIRFCGLESEYEFGEQEGFSYEVKNIKVLGGLQHVGIKRFYNSDKKVDGLKHFLGGFIQGNKRRYKVNLDNTISAIQSRGFEQFTLPKANELPIFISDNKGELKPRYALTCQNNQKTFQYWQDEKKQSCLHYLITPERLKRLQKTKFLGKPLVVYCFSHVSKGKKYFYTADNIQLQSDSFFQQQFLGFAASKRSFTIIQLSVLDYNETLADSPLTVGDFLATRDQYLNLPCSQQVKNLLKKLALIVTAYEIKNDAITQFYRTMPHENINIAKLKQFVHKPQSGALAIESMKINYNDQRQEARFKYNTPISVNLNNTEFHGITYDFSTNGIKVKFKQKMSIEQGDIIEISFPELQKITSSFELSSLPYEVMRLSNENTIVNLRVHVEKHQHTGRSFFKALIKKNETKLASDDNALSTPGLAKALRNIYGASSPSLSLIIQTSGSRYKIDTITCNGEEPKLLNYFKQLSDNKQYYNLYPLLNNLQVTTLMNNSLKQMKTEDEPITDTIYLSLDMEQNSVEDSVVTQLGSALDSDKLKKIFINKALEKTCFMCLQFKLSRAEEPDMELLNPELSYISSYAIHRGKQIEQKIWSVVGVIQIFDITQEVLIRHRMT
jgi:hypothetical protein